jgi:hypothetical protein
MSHFPAIEQNPQRARLRSPHVIHDTAIIQPAAAAFWRSGMGTALRNQISLPSGHYHLRGIPVGDFDISNTRWHGTKEVMMEQSGYHLTG